MVAATPKGYVGVNYNDRGEAVFASYTGGTGPLTWSVSSGSLPPGITVATERAATPTVGHFLTFSGAPTTPGTYNFIITGSDTLSISDTLSLSIVIEAPPNNTGGDSPGGGGTVPGVGGPDAPDKAIDATFSAELGVD